MFSIRLQGLMRQPFMTSVAQIRHFHKSAAVLHQGPHHGRAPSTKLKTNDRHGQNAAKAQNSQSRGVKVFGNYPEDYSKNYSRDYSKNYSKKDDQKKDFKKKSGDKYKKKKKAPLDYSQHPTLFKLVYESKQFAIINKTPGLDVQRSQPSGLSTVKPGLFTILIKINPFLKNVHRIDKPVGGGILLSKGKTAAKMFSRNLRFGGLKGYPLTRRYVAMVPIGEIKNSETVTMLDDNVGVIETEYQHPKFSRTKFIRTGVTNGKFQLLVLELETGRKHQIREHLSKEVGLPIFNDDLYGSKDIDPEIQHAIGLHSSYIGATVGQQKHEFLIPVHFVKHLWKDFIDDEGNFNQEIQTTLKNFTTIFKAAIPPDQKERFTTPLTTKFTLL